MLSDFFKLDTNGHTLQLANATALENHFTNSNELIQAKVIGIEFPERSRIFEGRTFRKVQFNRSSFSQITFKNCVFEDCLFVGCQFCEVEFHDTKFFDCNFYKAKFAKVYLDVRLVKFDKKFRSTHSNVMLGFYQEIFDNYADAHQWKFSLFADVERRRWDRFQIHYNIRDWSFDRNKGFQSIWELAKKLVSWLGNFFSDHLMSYGYGPFKFLFWSLVLISILSAIILRYWAVFEFGQMDKEPQLADSFFYVSTIWSTLGYSTHTPTAALGLYISSALGLAGIAWTGLFIAILIRRFVR